MYNYRRGSKIFNMSEGRIWQLAGSVKEESRRGTIANARGKDFSHVSLFFEVAISFLSF